MAAYKDEARGTWYVSSYNKCIASRNDGYALILSIDL